MMLGASFPSILIAPFDHGIEMNPSHPYTYIRALYNLVVCTGVGVIVTYTTAQQKAIVEKLKAHPQHKNIFISFIVISIAIFVVSAANLFSVWVLLLLSLVLLVLVALTVTYYVKYDEEQQLEGLTVWSIARAKEMFKGSKINDEEGEIVTVNWKIKEGEDDIVNLSKEDMLKMKANPGDLVYLCDSRKYLGGLKSIHSVIGEPHDETGVVYINDEQMQSGVFVKRQAFNC